MELPVIIGSSDSPSRLLLAGIFMEQPAPRSFPRAMLARVTEAAGRSQVIPIQLEHAAGQVFLRTTRAYFRRAQGRSRLIAGRYFNDEETGTAVAGSAVAAATSSALGSRVTAGSFGAVPLKVVGVLAPTGTALDRTVFSALPADASSLSLVALVPAEGFDIENLRLQLRDLPLTVVEAEPTLRRLVRLVAAVDDIVDWLSGAIAALAALLVLATFYSSLRERVRDLAVLRIVGARKRTLLLMLLMEAFFVGATGAALGLIIARLLLLVATEALADAGYAFRADVSDGPLVALLATAGVVLVGAAVGRSVYRIDPVTGLAGIHRPWSEVVSVAKRRQLRRSLAILFVFTVMFLPSAMHRPSPRSRLPNAASSRLFNLLERWDGRGAAPPEMTRLEGTVIELEGYQYRPAGPAGAPAGWRSSLLLVSQDHNMPVELFHEEHHPGTNELIRVELVEPIEATLYPVQVRGTFRISPSAHSLYQLTSARAKVLALKDD